MDAHALIIDDNPINIEVMGELLLACGMSYTAVDDSADLGAVVDGLEFLDIVFVDLEMPRINGYEVLDILRRDLGVNVPIVASTVHTNELQTAREMGFDSFLGKPLKMHQFADQVARILDGGAVWDV